MADTHMLGMCGFMLIAIAKRGMCGCRIAEGTSAVDDTGDVPRSRQTQPEAIAAEVMPFLNWT